MKNIFFKFYFFFLITVLVASFGIIENSQASNQWVANPSSCTATHSDFPGQSCTPNNICGNSSGIAQCYDTASIAKNSASTTRDSASQYSGSLGGGYITDCNATSDAAAPYCDNSGNFWCNVDTSCSSNYLTTICAANKWSGESSAFSCGSCLTGYQDCNSSPGNCEVQTGVTSHGTNVVYASSCGYQCSSGYLDCNGDSTGSDGACEIQVGATCTTAEGLQGVYGPTCNGVSGNCVVDTVNFQTGVEAKFTTSSPLLWGTQYGTGNLLQLMKNNVTSSAFVITNTGAVGIGTTTPESSAALEIKSSSGGLLLPRLNNGSISNPVAGLIIYDTNDGQVRYYNGVTWVDWGTSPTSTAISGGGISNYLTRWISGTTVSTSLIYVDENGHMGIGTTDVTNYAFNVSGTTHFTGDVTVSGTLLTTGTSSLATDGGSVLIGTTTNVGGLKVRIIGKNGAQYYCDANGTNCYDPTNGWATPQARYVTTTAVTYTGDFTTSSYVGYEAGNYICSSTFSGYHMCFTGEIIDIIRLYGTTGFANNGWISEGPPGYVADANDCGGWTASSSLKYGPWWSFSVSGGGSGRLTTCNLSQPISCCK